MYSTTIMNKVVDLVTDKTDGMIKLGMPVPGWDMLKWLRADLQRFADKACDKYLIKDLRLYTSIVVVGGNAVKGIAVGFSWGVRDGYQHPA